MDIGFSSFFSVHQLLNYFVFVPLFDARHLLFPFNFMFSIDEPIIFCHNPKTLFWFPRLDLLFFNFNFVFGFEPREVFFGARFLCDYHESFLFELRIIICSRKNGRFRSSLFPTMVVSLMFCIQLMF